MAEDFARLSLGHERPSGKTRHSSQHEHRQSSQDWMANLSIEDQMLLEELERQEAELSRIQSERSRVESTMRQIEDGDMTYEMPTSRHDLFEDELFRDEDEDSLSPLSSPHEEPSGGRFETPRSRRLRESSQLEGSATQPIPQVGAPPRLPKNWKNDYGNWIYILGTSSSSIKAKEVAQKRTIENYAPVRSQQAH